MTAVAEIIRVLLAALVRAGVAFRAGWQAAQNRQATIDKDAADEAIEARRNAGTGGRDGLVDELRKSGNLRD